MKTISLDGITYQLVDQQERHPEGGYVDTQDDCQTELNLVREYLVKKIRGSKYYNIQERKNRMGGTYFTQPVSANLETFKITAWY
jgi:hypothetical protein